MSRKIFNRERKLLQQQIEKADITKLAELAEIESALELQETNYMPDEDTIYLQAKEIRKNRKQRYRAARKYVEITEVHNIYRNGVSEFY